MSNELTTSLFHAANEVARVCSLIDDEVNIDELLVQEFNDSLQNISRAVDRRKAFLVEIESRIALAKEYKKQAEAAQKKFENLKQRVVDSTKKVIEQHPDIVFKDSLGKELKVIKNQPKLIIKNENWKFSPYSYIKNTIELNKDLLKEDLKDGVELDFAELESGTQLRGLK